MASKSLIIGVPAGGDDEAAEGEMPMDEAAPELDPREASAKAVMSALKSGNALKFADALEEFLMSIDTDGGDEEMPEEAMPPSDSGMPEDMGF